MSEAEAATLAELRRRMQGSFSPGELRDLGVAVGLSHVEAWDRGPESAVRDIVRRASEGPGLGVLLARLRVDRPLVEWPDPAPPRPAPAELVASVADLPDLDAPTVVEGSGRPLDLTPPPIPVADALAAPTDPDTLGGSGAPSTDAVGPTFKGPASAGPASAGPASAVPASAGPASAGPASAGPASNGWPMANLREPEKRSGLDPRILAIAVACVALAVVVAFVGGIVFSRRGAPAKTVAAGRADGLAGKAADVMDGAIVEVARGCGLVVEGPPDRSVLKRAQVQCGHPVAAAGRPPQGYDPADIEPPKLDVPPENPRTKPITGPGGPAAPPADLCRAGCKTERRTCMSACGAEPHDAIDFDAYQQCHSKCLGGESTCRQRCP